MDPCCAVRRLSGSTSRLRQGGPAGENETPGEVWQSVYFAEVSTSQQPELHFDFEYDVLRRERIGLRNAAHLAPASLSTEEGQKDLQPDVLVPTSGLPADLAAKVRQGKLQLLEKARAIFDYVFAAIHYDKTGTGWGRGHVLYACDGQEGQLKQSSEIAGYHCWSDFYVDRKGWIPVDISEAWKHQGRRGYFYGSHDVNRIHFSIGRDLRLNLLQGRQAAELFCICLCGSRWAGVSQRLTGLFVCGCSVSVRRNSCLVADARKRREWTALTSGMGHFSV